MALSNKQLLKKLDKAFKNVIDRDALGDSVLVPQQFDRFVRSMQHDTVILPEARYIEMQSEKTNIDRVAFIGRILKSGREDDEERTHKNLEEGDFVKPTFATNQLVAEELQAIVSIYDKALRRNIERGNFENTLVELFGEAAGRDLEEWGLLADEDIDDDLVLQLTDGWLKLADSKVYGQGESADFDPDADDYPRNVLQAMLKALPKQYLQDRGDWRYWVDFEIEDGLRDLYAARGTDLGDVSLTDDDQLYYKGIPVRYAPMLERSKAGHAGERVATLQYPDNMAWGVFHEVNIESEREAKKRRTDFVLALEADSGYEDEEAAVAAFIDKEGPND